MNWFPFTSLRKFRAAALSCSPANFNTCVIWSFCLSWLFPWERSHFPDSSSVRRHEIASWALNVLLMKLWIQYIPLKTVMLLFELTRHLAGLGVKSCLTCDEWQFTSQSRILSLKELALSLPQESDRMLPGCTRRLGFPSVDSPLWWHGSPCFCCLTPQSSQKAGLLLQP